MAEFEQSWALVRQFEGGWSNHKHDRGGETYAGIARNFFPDWTGWPLIDSWKKNVGADAKVLNKTLPTDGELQRCVADWYRREWWDKLGLSSLPQSLADEIFEQSVNLGMGGAVKKIQLLCNAYNWKSGRPIFADLSVDGSIGPKTIAALRCLLETRADAKTLCHALNCLQGAHYLELAARNPAQRQFTAGWMSRTHGAE